MDDATYDTRDPEEIMDLKEDYGVYQIVNTITGKRYVGATTMCFEKRFYMHRWSLNSKKHSHSSKELKKDWHRYGEDAFRFLIIESGPKDLSRHRKKAWCNRVEKQYIDPIVEDGDLYNRRLGGSSGGFLNPDHGQGLCQPTPPVPVIWTDQQGRDHLYKSQAAAMRALGIKNRSMYLAMERGGWGTANRTPAHLKGTSIRRA